jgi:hypothetical protein
VTGNDLMTIEQLVSDPVNGSLPRIAGVPESRAAQPMKVFLAMHTPSKDIVGRVNAPKG